MIDSVKPPVFRFIIDLTRYGLSSSDKIDIDTDVRKQLSIYGVVTASDLKQKVNLDKPVFTVTLKPNIVVTPSMVEQQIKKIAANAINKSLNLSVVEANARKKYHLL